MKSYISILTIVLFLYSCSRSAEQSFENTRLDKAGYATDYAEAEEVMEETSGSGDLPHMGQKLIKNGEVRFETDDLISTRKHVMRVMEQFQGYISDEHGSSDLHEQSESITIRVISDNFDALLDSILSGVKYVDHKSVNVQDVTEQFVDLTARIKAKKELEQRYYYLLNRARNVEEMLEIEKQIGILRSDIEAMTGRLRYLDNQTSYSTLQVSYYKVISNPTNFGSKAGQGFASGWDNVRSLILGLISIWPFLILLGAASFLLYRRLRTQRSGVK